MIEKCLFQICIDLYLYFLVCSISNLVSCRYFRSVPLNSVHLDGVKVGYVVSQERLIYRSLFMDSVQAKEIRTMHKYACICTVSMLNSDVIFYILFCEIYLDHRRKSKQRNWLYFWFRKSLLSLRRESIKNHIYAYCINAYRFMNHFMPLQTRMAVPSC